MNKKVVQILSGVTFLLIITVPTLYASLFFRVDLADIVNKSDIIVHGIVTKLETKWNEDNSLIFTYATIKLQNVFKGKASKEIVVKELGGEIDGMISEPIGFPQFKLGQEVILFLTRWPDGAFRVVEYTQGKYNVITNRITGEKTLIREDLLLGNVEFIGDPTQEYEELTKVITIDQLISKIRLINKVGK